MAMAMRAIKKIHSLSNRRRRGAFQTAEGEEMNEEIFKFLFW